MRIWILALVLCACGKSSSEKKSDQPPAEDKQQDDKPKKQPAEAAFPGPKVSLPTPVAKLALDLSEADAKAAAPDLFAAEYGWEVPEFEGLKINASIQEGRLYQIYVEIKQPIDTVKAWLTKKWFAPRESKNSIGNPLLYFDSPDVGLRAVLESTASNSMLRYYKVMSLEQLLGKDKQWGFEKTPLLGTSQDDLMKTYAEYHPTPRPDDPSSIALSLPALPTSEYGNHVSVRVKNGKVTGYTLEINSGGDAATDAAILSRLEAMFGKGKVDSMGQYTDFAGPQKAKAEIRKTDAASFAHTVWVGDYKK